MRIRHFLVVHPSRSIRAMMKRCILAEYGDVKILETPNGKEAIALAADHALDLVIGSSDLVDMPFAEVKSELMQTLDRKDTAFVALCESDEHQLELSVAGFEHILTTPFDPEALMSTIYKAADPRKWRQTDRFHIPKSKAILNVWGMEAEAKMINISRGGVLIEISDDRSDLLLQNDPKLTLLIKGPHDYFEIPGLPCKITRLNAVEWNGNYKPIVMRVAYHFLNLEKHAEESLTHVLQMAKESCAYADDEQ